MMSGVRPEQGPPLAVPAAFFVAGALALAGAGAWLAAFGASALANRYLPAVLGLTHLITVGHLGAVMMGALYQMVPVVAGAPVPAPRLAFGVLALWSAGLLALLMGFTHGLPLALHAAAGCLLAATLLFAGPVGWALARAPTRGVTVAGLRAAVLGLAAVVVLGALMALLRAGVAVPTPLLSAWTLHVGLGALVWVAGLVAAVSWQVLPMFYTAPSAPPAVSWAAHGAVLVALAVGAATFALDLSPALTRVGLLPAALAAFLGAPATWLWLLARRKRRRADASVVFWRAAAAAAPVAGLAWGVAWWRPEPRWVVLAGWLFFVGFGATVVHGMLTRIVPFLAWFHRSVASVGRAPVPPMRQLWPETRVQLGLRLHLAAVALGAAATALESDALARLAGATLAAAAVTLGRGLFGALRIPEEPGA
jgi:hypothetical protein